MKIKGATVRFENDYGKSKEYEYLTSMMDLKQGDLVVVEARDWYQVATFMRYKKSEKATKHIVQKIDIEEVEKERKIAIRAHEIKEQIKERMKEVREMNAIKELAESDNELSDLVKELEGLGK